jgi:hypothetical protein
VDNGAYTGCMGYDHPTDAPGAAWTSSWAAVAGPKSYFVDNGVVTPRLGYAQPTTAPGLARTLSQGPMALSDPRCPGGPYGDEVGERSRPAASTPLARPGGLGLRPRGVTRPSAPAEGLP